MLDQLSNSYAQMQPGDKMVMQLHKSPKPPQTEYAMPEPSASLAPGGPAGSMTSAPTGGQYPQANQRAQLLALMQQRFGGPAGV
jgi:hypothetical protein